MTYELHINWQQRNREQQAINDWLLDRIENETKAVFCTLKFRHKLNEHRQYDDIGNFEAVKILRTFLRKIDFHYFAERKVKNGYEGTNRLVFKHLGKSKINTHFHIVFFPSVNVDDFIEVAKHKLESMNEKGWIDLKRSEINAVGIGNEEIKNTTFYCAKEVRNIGLENSFMETETYIGRLN